MTNALTSFAKFCDELAPCLGPFLERAAEIARALEKAQFQTCVSPTKFTDFDEDDKDQT